MNSFLSDFLMPVLLAAGTICAVAELFLMGLAGFVVCLGASLIVIVGVYCLQRFGQRL